MIMKNKMVDDLSVIDWKSMFIIGQKIGTSNFILQFLDQSLKKFDNSQDSRKFFNAFGLNSQILYVYKNEMTEFEKDKIRLISNVHQIDFIDYESLSAQGVANIASQAIFTHVVFDDIKPFYSAKSFNSFIKSLADKNKKVICGYQSTDVKMKNIKFLSNMDFILKLNAEIQTNLYDVELLSNINDPKVKRRNFYAVEIKS